MAHLRAVFQCKAEECRDVLKMGRTQLQEAVLPIRGINLGATAIGTAVVAKWEDAIDAPVEAYGQIAADDAIPVPAPAE
jgi:aspartate ammonia-lyase